MRRYIILDWIDIHNVGFGECIVLGGDNEILMVDCGSMNTVIKDQNITFKNYVKTQIIPRYFDIKEKSFLLTHFHKDHINGFKYILKESENYFDKIYIPHLPIDSNGNSALLELTIFSFVFLNKKTICSQMNIAPMFIFSIVKKCIHTGEIITLKKGDVFEAFGCKYEVLNPNNTQDNQSFSTAILQAVGNVNEILRRYANNLKVKKCMELKEKFCQVYLECCEVCSCGNQMPKQALIEKINELDSIVAILSNLSKDLSKMMVGYEVSQILNDENIQNEYSNIQNELSIVFQNKISCNKNMIMTGDATESAIFSIKDMLFDRYHIFKAPHHGTEGNYCKVFDNIFKDHVIISNGDYHAGGKISPKYCGNHSINHCTDRTVCKYFTQNKSCCNRLCYCSDLTEDFPLKCKHTGLNLGVSSCNIYIVSSNSDRGCFCDA